MERLPRSVDETERLLERQNYLAARPLAVAIFLALQMRKPLLLEGEAGVGKTEIAKALAAALGRDLIRLQCFEGIDSAAAAYDWDYPRQMLAARLLTGDSGAPDSALANLYDEKFLLRRPLLAALSETENGAPVLLIDELDRADDPFDAFLLEFLAEWQITIPEFAAVRAKTPPIAILTSNRTREIHDAVKRRCFYHWVDFPDAAREAEIIRRRRPEVEAELAAEIAAFARALRGLDLFKIPGVAETIDWAQALTRLGARRLSDESIAATLGALLKYQDDMARVESEIAPLREKAQSGGEAKK